MTTPSTSPSSQKPPTELFPRWWAPVHASSWDRVKEALHRDWEQTKAHFSMTSGLELNQDLADTLKQAAGVEAIPSIARANDDPVAARAEDWHLVEPALRYGFSARTHFTQYQAWNDEVENLLRADWESLWGRSWEKDRSNVRRGWEAADQSP